MGVRTLTHVCHGLYKTWYQCYSHSSGFFLNCLFLPLLSLWLSSEHAQLRKQECQKCGEKNLWSRLSSDHFHTFVRQPITLATEKYKNESVLHHLLLYIGLQSARPVWFPLCSFQEQNKYYILEYLFCLLHPVAKTFHSRIMKKKTSSDFSHTNTYSMSKNVAFVVKLPMIHQVINVWR